MEESLSIPSDFEKIADKIINYYHKYGNEDYIGEKISQISHMIQCAMLAEEEFPDDIEIILGAFLHDLGHLLAFEFRDRIKDKDYKEKLVENCKMKAQVELQKNRKKTIEKCDLSTEDKEEIKKNPEYIKEFEKISEEYANDLFSLYCNQYKINDYGVQNHEHLAADLLHEYGFSKKICDIVRYHVSGKRYLCAVDPTYHDKLSEASKKTLIEQGGPFNERQIEAYKENENWELFVKMRLWDDKAKKIIPKEDLNNLDYYKNLMEKYLKNMLKKEEK